MLLENSSTLVTGGSSGLGAATVRRLHQSGSHVVILDLPCSKDGAEQLIAELGCGVTFVAGDVTEPDDVATAVAAAVKIAPLRVAVATAGISTADRLIGRKSQVERRNHFVRTIQVNLVGTFNLLTQSAETMARNDLVDGERGLVVCTASIAAFEGQIGQVAYSASKSGVVGMTLPAARELAQNSIRVMTIAPGLFDTPMLARVPEAVRASVAAQVPHPARLGQPHEYAALVLHIVENPMLNGEVVRLDGAIRMGVS
ncbi:SDR family NAD(P)-dependent oxidoreductase [Cryobacterium sp. M15]|uniref:SDR family NAD(P)-dependent oxidoreductase n=1 Tax=Cryobacterium sp. M15 TaxID=2048291 RepID=UPI0018EAF25E|nr:SDR family NAD(P)-dependent oxidoreductase [Cryobacterium sp. M15]